VPDAARSHFRRFLADAIPALTDAPIVEARACVYCDTFDGHFWIDWHPERSDLMVVAGGSGHGFKFTPRVVDWVGELLAGQAPIPRFAWRARGGVETEDARAAVSMPQGT
jgi:glycine/D-amino acid oxidase-like deaminating enzyme